MYNSKVLKYFADIFGVIRFMMTDVACFQEYDKIPQIILNGRKKENIDKILLVLNMVQNYIQEERTSSIFNSYRKSKLNYIEEKILSFGKPYCEFIKKEGKTKNYYVISKKRTVFLYSVLNYAIQEISQFLKDEKFDMAYDFIDAIHCLPEIMLYSKKVDCGQCWISYIEPIRKKYGDEYFELVKYGFSGKL